TSIHASPSRRVSTPTASISRQPAIRIVDGKHVGCMERIRINNKIDAARVHRTEQHPAMAGGHHLVGEHPARWFNSVKKGHSAPVAIKLLPATRRWERIRRGNRPRRRVPRDTWQACKAA